MKKSILAFALVALFSIGCASTDKIVYDSTPRKPSTTVEIFTTDAAATGKAIAELTFLGPATDALRAQKFFIKEAQKLGGNGIIFWKTGGNLGATGFGPTLTIEPKYLYHGKILVY